MPSSIPQPLVSIIPTIPILRVGKVGIILSQYATERAEYLFHSIC